MRVLLFLCTLSSLLLSSRAFLQSCERYKAWGARIFECRIIHQCFPAKYECDSIIDCLDYSDEDHCMQEWEANCIKDFENKFSMNGEPLSSYQCDNGQCVLGCARCDGLQDCMDYTDENGCSPYEILNPPPCN